MAKQVDSACLEQADAILGSDTNNGGATIAALPLRGSHVAAMGAWIDSYCIALQALRYK